MSEYLQKRAWAKGGLSVHEKITLLALADYASDSGVSDNTMAEIAEKCGLSEQGLRYQMRKLQKRGLLEVHERPGAPNIFVVILK